MICDIIFYLVFANIFAQTLFESAITSLAPPLIMSACAAGAYLLHKVRPWLRFFALLPLPLCLVAVLRLPLSAYPAQNIACAALLAAPCLYVALHIALKKFHFGTERLTGRIKVCSIIVFVPLLMLIFGGYAYLTSLRYFHNVIIYSGCALCILRLARADHKTLAEPKYIITSIIPVIICLAALMLLGSPQVLRALWQGASFVFIKLILPVITVIVNILNWLFAKINISALAPLTTGYVLRKTEVGPDPVASTLEGAVIPDFVLYSIAAIIVIAFGIFVARRFKIASKRKHLNNSFEETRSYVAAPFAETQPAAKPSLFTPRNPRLAVRHHYRRFLQMCAGKGHAPKKGDTSQDINLKNQAVFSAANMAKLRELYIKARYSEHAISSKEGKEAGELVKEL
jgi:hypothetical protein